MSRRYGVQAPQNVKRGVQRLVEERGIDDAADLLGVCVESVGRVALGSAVQRGTLALVQSRLSDALASNGGR